MLKKLFNANWFVKGKKTDTKKEDSDPLKTLQKADSISSASSESAGDVGLSLENVPNWVDEYQAKHPEQKAEFEKNSIIDEASYCKVMNNLGTAVAHQAENFRYDFFFDYIDQQNPLAVIKICPTWLLQLDLVHFQCNRRLKNLIAKSDLKIVQDFGKFETEKRFRHQNIGKKTISKLAACIHDAKQKGPPPSEKNMHSPYKNLSEAFYTSLNKITDERHRYILEKRLGVSGQRKSLRETAEKYRLTRERVRQVQNWAVQQINDDDFWDDYLKIRIRLALENTDTPIYLDKLSEIDPWLSGFEGKEQLLKRIILHFAFPGTKFLDVKGRSIVCRVNNYEWKDLKLNVIQQLKHSQHLQYSRNDVWKMIENVLAGFKAKELTSVMLDELSPALNFSSDDSDLILLSVGNSITNRLKAVLNAEPKPLHYSRIRDLYEDRYGVNIDERNVRAKLTNGDFLLFKRGIYGMQKHVTVSEKNQTDITIQAERFLEKHANKQCHSHEIIRSIKGHNIDEYLMNIIIKRSKKITFLGKMVWTFGTDVERSQRLNVNETVVSILRKNGGPMSGENIEREVKNVRGVVDNFARKLQPGKLFARVDSKNWGLLERDFILSEEEWGKIKDYIFQHFTKAQKTLRKHDLFEIVHELNIDKKITPDHLVGVLVADGRFRKRRNESIGLTSWNAARE